MSNLNGEDRAYCLQRVNYVYFLTNIANAMNMKFRRS